VIKNKKSFGRKNVNLAETPLFFPAGSEHIFLILYFISLPYIAGILFLFIYVSQIKLDIFKKLWNDSSYVMVWAIGYEILATLILLLILKSALKYSKEAHYGTGAHKRFVRP